MSTYGVVIITGWSLLPTHIMTIDVSGGAYDYRQPVNTSKTDPPLEITSFVSPITSFRHIAHDNRK